MGSQLKNVLGGIDMITCDMCDGLGIVEDPTGKIHRLGSDEIKCPKCNGRGVVSRLTPVAGDGAGGQTGDVEGETRPRA